MKALPSIAFNEFTGSAGDVTARTIGGRTLLNHKAYQSKVKTPAQAAKRWEGSASAEVATVFTANIYMFAAGAANHYTAKRAKYRKKIGKFS